MHTSATVGAVRRAPLNARVFVTPAAPPARRRCSSISPRRRSATSTGPSRVSRPRGRVRLGGSCSKHLVGFYRPREPEFLLVVMKSSVFPRCFYQVILQSTLNTRCQLSTTLPYDHYEGSTKPPSRGAPSPPQGGENNSSERCDTLRSVYSEDSQPHRVQHHHHRVRRSCQAQLPQKVALPHLAPRHLPQRVLVRRLPP
jgi:hypothetical protein